MRTHKCSQLATGERERHAISTVHNNKNNKRHQSLVEGRKVAEKEKASAALLEGEREKKEGEKSNYCNGACC